MWLLLLGVALEAMHDAFELVHGVGVEVNAFLLLHEFLELFGIVVGLQDLREEVVLLLLQLHNLNNNEIRQAGEGRAGRAKWARRGVRVRASVKPSVFAFLMGRGFGV